MKTRSLLPLLFAVGFSLVAEAAAPRELPAWLQTIKSVESQGRGNTEAAQAWQHLADLDIKYVVPVLEAMDGANEFALNWLRAAADAMVDRGLRAGEPLPIGDLKRFLADTEHHPRSRRLAYEWIARADPGVAEELRPTFLNDPSNELRRDAVQLLVDQAAQSLGGGQTNAAVATYQKALSHSRDVDQIEALSKKLRELGQTVDLQRTFGWLTQWKVIGPFDNTGGKGFDAVYPPETAIDLDAEYDGKAGKVRWQNYQTKDDYGMINFNEPFTALKAAAGYALAEFHSDQARPVELRLGGKNSWKIWLNGKYLFGRDEYHRGAEIDQYRLRAELQPGKNTLLVKCCQNEQKETWTVEWQFQFRITDAQGTPIASAK